MSEIERSRFRQLYESFATATTGDKKVTIGAEEVTELQKEWEMLAPEDQLPLRDDLRTFLKSHHAAVSPTITFEVTDPEALYKQLATVKAADQARKSLKQVAAAGRPDLVRAAYQDPALPEIVRNEARSVLLDPFVLKRFLTSKTPPKRSTALYKLYDSLPAADQQAFARAVAGAGFAVEAGRLDWAGPVGRTSGRVAMNFNLQDLDGVETMSRGDIAGSIRGEITFDRSTVENAIDSGFKKDGYITGFHYQPTPPRITVDIVDPGIPIQVGTLTLDFLAGKIQGKMELGNPDSTAVDLVLKGYNLFKDKAEGTAARIRNAFADMGFTVSGSGKNFEVYPSMKRTTGNQDLLTLPIGKGRVVSIDTLGVSRGGFTLDPGGSVIISVDEGSLRGSSASVSSATAVPDAEGPDTLKGSTDVTVTSMGEVRGELRDGRIDLHITEGEAVAAGDMLTTFTGQELKVSGDIALTDLSASMRLDPKPGGNKEVTEVAMQGDIQILNGRVVTPDAHYETPGARAHLAFRSKQGEPPVVSATEGEGTITRSKRASADNGLRVRLQDISLTAQVNGIDVTLGLKDTGATTGAGNSLVALTGGDLPGVQVDRASDGTISIRTSQSLTLSKLQLGPHTLEGLSFLGTLTIRPDGSLFVNGSPLKIAKGKLGDVAVRDLAVNGSLAYEPQVGQGGARVDSIKMNIVAGKVAGHIGKMALGAVEATGDVNFRSEGKQERLQAFGSLSVQGAKIDKTQVNRATFTGALTYNPVTGSLTVRDAVLPASLRGRLGDLEVDLQGQNMEIKAHGIDGPITFGSRGNKPLVLSGTLGPARLREVQIQGQVTYDPRTHRLTVHLADLQARGQIGDVDLTKVTAQGDIVIDMQSGRLVSDLVAAAKADGFEVEASGIVTVRKQGQGYRVEADPDKPLLVQRLAVPAKGIQLSDLYLRGVANVDPVAGEIAFESAGGLAVSGQLGDLPVERAEAAGGDFHYDYKNKRLRPSTLRDPHLVIHRNRIDLQGKGQVHIEQGVTGHFTIDPGDATLTGMLGSFRLQGLKVNGEILYNPEHDTIDFLPPPYDTLRITGQIDGHRVDLKTEGVLRFEAQTGTLRTEGGGVKVTGRVDGIPLDARLSGQAEIKKEGDKSKVDASQGRIILKIGSTQIDMKGITVTSTARGNRIEVSASALKGNRDGLLDTLRSLRQWREFNVSDRRLLEEMARKMEKNFADFQLQGSYLDGLALETDAQGKITHIRTVLAGTLPGMAANIKRYNSETSRPVPLGDIQVRVPYEFDGTVDPPVRRLRQAEVSMSITPELRRAVAEDCRALLKAKGVDQLDLEVKPNGDIELKNARGTVVSTPLDLPGRLLREAGRATAIPVLSELLTTIGRFLSPTDISADFTGSAQPRGRKVRINVENGRFNQTLLQILTPALGNQPANAVENAAQENQLKPRRVNENIVDLDVTSLGHSVLGDKIHVREVIQAPGNRLIVKFDADS